MALPAVVTLYKYFIWSNSMRTHLDEVLPRVSPELDWFEPEAMKMNLYLSYWYGSLYVVIEGWTALGLSDIKIDALLKSPNVELLRRYRNGVFHLQKDYFDERFIGFMRDGVKSVEWVRNRNRAFGRYFLDWFATHNTDGSPKS